MKRVLPKEKIYLLLLISFLFFQNNLFAQPGGYAFRLESNGNFGTAYVLNNNSPTSGILSTTVQATSTADEYLVEWNGFADKWSNTNTIKNSETTFTWGGGGFNGPNGVLNGNFTNGKQYTLQIRGLSYSSRQGVMMETDNTPQSFSSVSQPSVVCAGSDATISVVLAGNKSAQERVFIRYAVNGNFGSSKVVEATGTGATWSTATATIPGADHLAGTVINYYAYTTTVAATNASDHDLITLRFGNNGGSNYSYGVAANVTYYTDNDGDGFGFASVVSCTGQPVGAVANNSDSNDNLVTYTDVDGDGFGSDTFAPSGVTNSDDTDDTLLTFVDADNDTFGSAVLAPSGVANSEDCNDANPAINPNAVEVCYDGIDNDCDGTVDNGCTPIVSEVQTAQCGQTLPTIDSYVYANLVSQADQYRFKVTNVASGQEQSIDRFLRVFKITQLPTYEFSTEYKVEVAVRINGIWQPFFGAPCTVFTPASLTQLTNCGDTLNTMQQVIYANLVPYATGYRFRVTNIINPLETQTIDRQLREFRMSLLNNIHPNTQYYVEVAVRKRDGITYLPYGPTCIVATPAFPASYLQDSQCNDYQVPSNSTVLYAESYAGAEGYRFKLENFGLGYAQEVDRVLRAVSLNNFTGLTAGVNYSVKVALKINGVWGEFSGKSCSIVTPGAAKTANEMAVAKATLEVAAAPNPFASTFAIHLQNASQDIVSIKVYDMLGRTVEQTQVKATDLQHTTFGNGYPAGVYQVIITQGEITQALRMIKR